MRDAAFEGCGAGEFKATAHCGGGTGLSGSVAIIGRRLEETAATENVV